VHPDRLVGASPDELERAHFKMHELNAAWEVLRDPERRAAYDTTRPGAPVTVVDPGGSPAPRIAGFGGAPLVGSAPTRTVADLEPEVEGAPTVVRRRRWSRHGPALAVGALVLLVTVIALLATLTAEPEPTNVETTERFPVGSCVTIGLDQVVEEASCVSAGAREIVAKEAFPRPCPSGTEALVLIEQNVSLCLPGR
jgi:hypothetical protein